MQRRNASQVCTYAQGGGDPVWLGTIGHVAGLKNSFTYPGGCDQMSCLLQVPPTQRVPAMNSGRLVRIWRGASVVWNGQLDEPQPDTAGWTVTAHGSGTFGTQFCDIWDTWGNPDDHVSQAIDRGLNWVNPGISTTGLWFGDETDAGSQTITDFLNGITVQGAYGWTVDPRDNTLTVAPLPTEVTRILVATNPVPRTVASDINRLFVRWEQSADTTSSASPASYGLISEENAADIAVHGVTESYYDDTGNGVITESQAQANATAVLSRYNRANFTQPITVGQGQLLNTGGFPVDLGCEQAGSVCWLVLTDFGYGGEVSAVPVTFIVGAYQYDDTTQTAQITPYLAAADDFTSLLAAIFPVVSTVA